MINKENINIESLESFEIELNKMSKEDHVNTLIDTMKFIDSNKDEILSKFQYTKHSDIERLKELYEQVNIPLIWNYQLLEECSQASIMDWDKTRTIVIHELSIDWELRAFLPVQEIDDPQNNRKYVEGFGSFMIESKEVFWLTFFEKEVLRRYVIDNYSSEENEYDFMFGNMQMQYWIQKRFNYYAINVANLEKIEDYFNLMPDAKKRQAARARYRKYEANEEIEYEMNLLDESFDVKWFLDRWIELAKRKWETNLIWYWTLYEQNIIKAHIRNWNVYEMKVNFKWKNICHYLISVIDWIIHEITWYYDNFDFEPEDKTVADQASKYLVYKRVQYAIENKIPLILEWPGNFGWKIDHCNVCWYVYFLNL